jgi:hypothetical protein
MRTRRLNVLRGVAIAAVVVGALVSFGLMLHIGRYRFSSLMLLFAIWDLSPFVALFAAGVVSKRWPVITRGALVMLIVAGDSVVIYGRVAAKAPTQLAFAFLIVPLASWVLLIVTVLIAHVISTKLSGRHERLFRG